MEQKYSACNNCKISIIEQMQHLVMLGMSDANILYQDYCEEQYAEIKYYLEMYMNMAETNLKDDLSGGYDYCNNCKSKVRVEKFKEYLDRMIKVINSDRYYYVEKLQRIYFLQDDYFEDCGSF
ncbi:hypothetical protein AB2T85_06315 [Clostridium butyricum]|uniref:hypothetical protein n=1 Tax=Clostridium butyricum TaxID=1492 RepID=UPI003467E79C